MSPPSLGHSTPVDFCLTNRHSGYPVHAVNSPNRPCLTTRFLPQFGHRSSSTWSGFAAVTPCFVAIIFRVVLHSGYPVQARNIPNLPRLGTIGRPQFSHVSSS